MSMSLGGAVDLSVFNKPEQPQAPGEPVRGPWVFDLTAQGLQGAVTTSSQVPVVVVFHSTHSENSETLVSILERLVTAKSGRIQLAKVSVDEHAEVAQSFGVSAVPAAAALLQGQPVPLFQGMPEEAQLEQTLDKLVEAAAQYGINGVLDNSQAPAEPEVPPLHREGREALEKGDLAAAHAAYTKALAENPGDDEAQTALHQVELLQRIEKLNLSGDVSKVEAVLREAGAAPATDVAAHLKAADVEFSLHRPDAAFTRLIEVVRATSGQDRDAARERLLAYFDILGPSQVVTQARKALTNALF
ncbi:MULTISPECIES: tetratricopeptide repeat protein [Trueperella]|uniref:Thioredoxin n=1 Tax=Trueperella abortisuis TaxID=445930 RepID=A0ABT9PJQ5_9ACTO|nr:MULTISPECIES: tetratricopeptide repeat protein [Trueperella]MCI7304954.1 tetratricopeptide repeat protein [Trueperella sp.]MDP9832956.1 putative thioredoxin [Trueperella abortisuis]MDY5404353.1 tetratricopeptide repeat protein [Trueperella sp.]